MVTCHTRSRLSVWPANRVWPTADEARESHWGSRALLLVLITRCFSSSTMTLPFKSQIWMLGLWQQSQCLLGLKQGALMMSTPSSVERCLPSLRLHELSSPWEGKSCPVHLCILCSWYRTRSFQCISMSTVDLTISPFAKATCLLHLTDSAS